SNSGPDRRIGGATPIGTGEAAPLGRIDRVNIVLWVIAGLLALMFLLAGVMKLARPKQDLAASGMTWTEDFSARNVKIIGVLEVLASAGLILPPATRIAPVLAPLAAAGIVLLMCGA